jgi:cytochrome b6-f complex iron-sulfur subunit
MPDPEDKSQISRVSRRGALKATLVFGAAILFLPVARLAQFLFPPRETGPIIYWRVRIANSEDLPVNESLLFEYPHRDRPAILIHLADGFVAFDALCTHLGCQVHYNKVAVKGWESNPRQSFCPCHGAVFDPKTGEVLAGPPPRPLPKIKIEIDEQGEIFANGYESGLPLYGES